jgi:DNA-binding SARP family transcriptional activator
LPDDWAATQREWLRSRQLFALTFLSKRRLKQGDLLSVIGLCIRMLSIDPLYEIAYRMVISVHGELGQLAQVQRWYSLCEKRLHDELQVTPDNETQRLYEQVLRGNYHVGSNGDSDLDVAVLGTTPTVPDVAPV